MSELSSHLINLRDQFSDHKKNLSKPDQLNDQNLEKFRITWLGKKGHISDLFSKLGDSSSDQKASNGKLINDFKLEVEQCVKDFNDLLINIRVVKLTSASSIDFSLPSQSLNSVGSLHPVTLATKKLIGIFHRLGFSIKDGPHIENDYFNFTALNIPNNHPARDMQDTFYLKQRPRSSSGLSHNKHNSNWLLRSQTSNIQIHTLLSTKPPIKIIAPGRVFRMDYDHTHTPMFHQIEGLVVDQNISMGDLKGTVICFLQEFFGSEAKVRFRPSYFPFVEPGAEIDMIWNKPSADNSGEDALTKWLEVGGCGMVHPNVFEQLGYDSEYYSGFAFGFGIDRLAMLKYNLSDLRQLFVGDQKFQSQFPIYTD